MAGVAELLDRLLVASCEMPPDADASKIVEAFIGIGAEALPGVGIGVRASQGSGAEVIVRRMSRSVDSATSDSERLFPSFEHERIIAIAAEGGAALHLASDDRAQVFLDAPREMFLQRLVMTIGA